ncbi:MAG: tetratricopeptide repeat protein, partial [Mesorhizobium sp.]
HAMMAFVGAGLEGPAQTLIEAQRDAMHGNDDNAAFTRDVGHPLTMAIKAFGAGSYDEAVRLIRPIRSIAHRFGGSHAQRDVIDLT